ncbi:hypothetical protein HA402_001424 [Bradysia odoriphaga]|nr:hypothetical protein HA402_001424 [Bradysia odoriphaga]
MSVIGVILLLSLFTLSHEAKPPMKLVPNFSRGFINNNLLDLLEELRIRMHMDMSEELGIPRLDPFLIAELDLEPILNDIELHLSNVRGVGLNRFVVNELDFNIFTLSFLFNLTTPTLTLSGDYVADGVVSGVIPFIGEGPFNIIIHNATIGIVGRLGLTETGSWTIHDLGVNFAISQFEGGFEGLTSELINDLLRLSAPALLEEAWPTLETIVIEMIYGLLGGAVNSMTTAELISLLSGNGLNWPDVEEHLLHLNV